MRCMVKDVSLKASLARLKELPLHFQLDQDECGGFLSSNAMDLMHSS